MSINTICATDSLSMMSTMFYTYRNGKKEKSYKYEDVKGVSYGKDKNGDPQIGVEHEHGNVTSYSWDLGDEDIRLTQESHEKAAVFYNERLIKVGKKRKRDELVENPGPTKKKRKLMNATMEGKVVYTGSIRKRKLMKMFGTRRRKKKKKNNNKIPIK